MGHKFKAFEWKRNSTSPDFTIRFDPNHGRTKALHWSMFKREFNFQNRISNLFNKKLFQKNAPSYGTGGCSDPNGNQEVLFVCIYCGLVNFCFWKAFKNRKILTVLFSPNSVRHRIIILILKRILILTLIQIFILVIETIPKQNFHKKTGLVDHSPNFYGVRNSKHLVQWTAPRLCEQCCV